MTAGSRPDKDEEYGAESIDALDTDVSRTVSADHLNRLRDAGVQQVEQANDLRGVFFKIACGLAGVTTVTSSIVVLSVVFGRPLDSAVAVAFISGLSVQTIGILLVVARYLFPRHDIP